MQGINAVAGHSRTRIKSKRPFVSADEKTDHPDGIFRVVLISTGSVASVKIPDIVGALSKDYNIAVQVVASGASLHFYSQDQVDASVRQAVAEQGSGAFPRDVPMAEEEADVGVRVWTDADEWSDWKKIGDPILHIELRRWADMVVVAPCSADILAKIAGGLSENLPVSTLSLLRALDRDTPVILCPAMNTHMYTHPFTAQHLQIIQEQLGYMVLGPQKAGTLACGDMGTGKMYDWRDIVDIIRNYAHMFVERQRTAVVHAPQAATADDDRPARPPTPPTPGRSPRATRYSELPPPSELADASAAGTPNMMSHPDVQKHLDATKKEHPDWRSDSWRNLSRQDWMLMGPPGAESQYWKKRWWMGV